MKKLFPILLLGLLPSMLTGCVMEKKSSKPVDDPSFIDIRYGGHYEFTNDYFDIQSARKPEGTLEIDAYIVNNTSIPIHYIDVYTVCFCKGEAPEQFSILNPGEEILAWYDGLGCSTYLEIKPGERYDFQIFLPPESYADNMDFFNTKPELGVNDAYLKVYGVVDPVKCVNRFSFKLERTSIDTDATLRALYAEFSLTNKNSVDMLLDNIEVMIYHDEPSLSTLVAKDSFLEEYRPISIKAGETINITLSFATDNYDPEFWDNTKDQEITCFLYATLDKNS